MMNMAEERKKEGKEATSGQKRTQGSHYINVFVFSYDNRPRNNVARWKKRGKLVIDGPKRNAERLRSIHKALKTRHHL
jgi:hypothetical protein